MKSILAILTLTLAMLVMEEKTRQVAGEAQEALGEAADQARDATRTVSRGVEQQPLTAILMAAAFGYGLAVLTPRRR